MKLKYTNILKILPIFITLIVLAELFFVLAIPNIINITKHENTIIKIFNSKTNANLNIDKFSLKTYPDFSVGLSASDINISEKKSKKTILDAKNVYVRIPLLPLILRQIDIKTVIAKNLTLDISRDKKGKYNIEKIIFKSEKKLFKTKFKEAKCVLTNYYIDFNDEMLSKKYNIKGNYFNIDDFTMKKRISVETDGVISSNDFYSPYKIKFYTKLPIKEHLGDSNFVIDGYVVDFKPNCITPYLNKYFDNQLKKIDGSVTAKFYTKKIDSHHKRIVADAVLDDILMSFIKPSENISTNGKLTLNGEFNLDSDKIDVKSLKIAGNKVNIEAEGKIKNYSEKKPSFDIEAQIIDSKAENIISLLPANLIPKREEVRKVKKYQMYGDISADIKVKGKIPEPNIIGTVKAQNVHILSKEDKSHTGTVNLTFDKRVLYTDVVVKLVNKANEQVSVKGTTYIFRDHPNHFVIKSTKNVPLKLTQKVLLPIRDVFMFQLGPFPKMNIIKGTGNTELDIKGTKLNGVVNGYINFIDAATTYEGINGVIKNVYGSVNFKEKYVAFKTTKGDVEGYPVSIYGHCIISDSLDLNIDSSSVDTKTLLNIVRTSPLLKEVDNGLVIIQKASGLSSLKINMKAKLPETPVPDEEALKIFTDTLKVNGSIALHNAIMTIQNYHNPIKNIIGTVNFSDTQVKFKDLKGQVASSKVTADGNILLDKVTKIPDVDVTVKGDKIQVKDSLKFVTESDFFTCKINLKPYISNLAGVHNLVFQYKAKKKDIDFNGIKVSASIVPQSSSQPLQINSGRLNIERGTLNLNNIKGKYKSTNITATGNVKNIFTPKPLYNLKLNIPGFNVSEIENLAKSGLMSKQLIDLASQYTNYSGKADIVMDIASNKLNGYINLSQIHLNHKKLGFPITIDPVRLKFTSDKLVADALTATISDAPLYSEITINNLSSKPRINGYITTKLTDNFIDTYINPKLTYPIKVKGDITLSSNLSGSVDNLNVDSSLKLNEDADITYMSTNLGDVMDTRELKGNLHITPTNLTVRKLDYIKYQTSQNNRTYPMNFATFRGNFHKEGDFYLPDSFSVRTNHSMPARLFNFAFKKSLLKKGTFNCSIFYKANTKSNVPKLFGSVSFKNVDIPIVDTLIKDINITSTRDDIDVSAKGILFDSDIEINANIANKVTYPIVINSAEVSSDIFNLDKILSSTTKMSIDNYQNNNLSLPQDFDTNNIILKSGKIAARSIIYRDLPAQNATAEFSFNDSILDVKNIHFILAGGAVSGQTKMNFKNNTTEADLSVENVDSTIVSEAFFNMKNQVYGKMNGSIILHSKGKTEEERLKNLVGNIDFNINDGRIPKLGSLEYLLKAGNLIKSGITGLTINSAIDIINPIRTGHFDSITGSMNIKDGSINDIEVFSQGDNLSLYLSGSYNLIDSTATMTVLGKLPKKIPTILGPIGNTSFNSLLNSIPGINLSDINNSRLSEEVNKIPGLRFSNNDYRLFQANIDGNINGFSYVTSFRWIE